MSSQNTGILQKGVNRYVYSSLNAQEARKGSHINRLTTQLKQLEKKPMETASREKKNSLEQKLMIWKFKK